MRRLAQHDIVYHNITVTHRMRHSMRITKQHIVCDIPYFQKSILKDIEYVFKKFCVIFWKISRNISKNIENNFGNFR